MKVQNNICEGSLITNYLPADYCDSVKFNNRLGRLYFFFIRPFHKTIMRSILNRVAKQMK